MKYLSLFLVFLFLNCNTNSKKDIEPSNKNAITYERICLDNPPYLGTVNDIDFFEGGFSGLTYDKASGTFFIVTDRGPNLKFKTDSIEAEIKVFPFPDYQPKIIQLQVEQKELIVNKTIPLFNFDGSNLVGLPFVNEFSTSEEMAWANTNGEKLSASTNGVDVEALALDKDGNFWIAEEYQTSIWKIDARSGKSLKKFTPNKLTLEEPNTYQIDSVFGYRKPNRGFESIALTPSGNLWGILQSPAWYPSKEEAKQTRLTRMIKINPEDQKVETYLYEMSEEKGVQPKDWKTGDMVAVSETDFLIIEHATRAENKYLRVFKISTENATELSQFHQEHLIYPEAMLNATEAKLRGVQVAKKTLVLDLLENGFDDKHNKPEGITIVDDRTLVIVNDNDYAIEFSSNQERFVNNNIKSCLYFYYLPKSLQDY